MLKIWMVAPLALLLCAAGDAKQQPSGDISIKGDEATLVHNGQRSELSLTFAEDFDSFSRFDGQNGFWRTTYWFDGSVGGRTMPLHGEVQLYVHPGDKGSSDAPLGIDPLPIRNGMLEITADRVTPEQSKWLWNYKYTSGLITTKDIFAQAYGYFEMRVKLPAGQGLWPAFWLAPQDYSWPPEIDVFETLGRQPSTVFFTVHINEGKTPEDKTQIARTYEGLDTSKDFHIYGMSWSPETIIYFIDRKEVAEIPTPKSVNKPMYVLANMALGGAWAGDPDETTPFPAKMIIDYIHIYQFKGLPRPEPGVVRPATYAAARAAPESAAKSEPSPSAGR